MDWNTEFNVTPEQVAAEVRRIQKEKRTYNDYGEPEKNRSYYHELRDKPCGQGKTALVKKRGQTKSFLDFAQASRKRCFVFNTLYH